MSKLSDLKTKAAAELATATTNVRAYVAAQEAKASTNKYWIGAGAVVGALIGWFAHKL